MRSIMVQNKYLQLWSGNDGCGDHKECHPRRTKTLAGNREWKTLKTMSILAIAGIKMEYPLVLQAWFDTAVVHVFSLASCRFQFCTKEATCCFIYHRNGTWRHSISAVQIQLYRIGILAMLIHNLLHVGMAFPTGCYIKWETKSRTGIGRYSI